MRSLFLSLLLVVGLFEFSLGGEVEGECSYERRIVSSIPDLPAGSQGYTLTYEDEVNCDADRRRAPIEVETIIQWISTDGTTPDLVLSGSSDDASIAEFQVTFTKMFSRDTGVDTEITGATTYGLDGCSILGTDSSVLTCAMDVDFVDISPAFTSASSVQDADPAENPPELSLTYDFIWFEPDADLVLQFQLGNCDEVKAASHTQACSDGEGRVVFSDEYSWEQDDDTGISSVTLVKLDTDELQIRLDGSAGKDTLEYEIKLLLDSLGTGGFKDADSDGVPDIIDSDDDDSDDGDSDDDDSDRSAASGLLLSSLLGGFAFLALLWQ